MVFVHVFGPVIVGLFAALAIVVGAGLVLRASRAGEQSTALANIFAFGTGAFFTAVLLDFLPEAWNSDVGHAALWVFLGAFFMWLVTQASDGWFVREQILQLGSRTDADSQLYPIGTTLSLTPASAIVLASALSFHTLLEGAAVALVFHHVSTQAVWFAVALVLHKLPEGVLWGLSLLAVFPFDRRRIRYLLSIPAICTVIGVLLGLVLAAHGSAIWLGIITGWIAGAMLYITFVELLPALREGDQPRSVKVWFIIGVGALFILNWLG